jgi:hypothetical protein
MEAKLNPSSNITNIIYYHLTLAITIIKIIILQFLISSSSLAQLKGKSFNFLYVNLGGNFLWEKSIAAPFVGAKLWCFSTPTIYLSS